MTLNIFKFLNFGFKPRVIQKVTADKISIDWRSINDLILKDTPTHLRQAVIVADNTLDAALKDIVAGDTMGERLKNAKDKFNYTTYDRLWKAHKLRNGIVHETSFEPNHFMVKEAIQSIKDGLIILGIRL